MLQAVVVGVVVAHMAVVRAVGAEVLEFAVDILGSSREVGRLVVVDVVEVAAQRELLLMGLSP